MNNQIIHEWMGLCWHDVQFVNDEWPDGTPWSGDRCLKCGLAVDEIYNTSGDSIGFNPAYDSEDSPRSLLSNVEAKVIEAFGEAGYLNALRQVFSNVYGNHDAQLEAAVFATASQRVEAIVSLISKEGKDVN
jgi:imidazole glycerol phosphate synthase subunit HisF